LGKALTDMGVVASSPHAQELLDLHLRAAMDDPAIGDLTRHLLDVREMAGIEENFHDLMHQASATEFVKRVERKR
jgi:hypothetical protein